MNLKLLFTITLSALLLVILFTVFVINIRGVQNFIENQVYSTSQDTVYSLGMSLSTLDENASTQDIELIVNAIFDSGYYEYIRFYDLNQTLIYEATLPVVVKEVPQWFISFVPIHLQEASGTVNDAWRAKGTLALKGHAGYAYYELWKAFKDLIFTFGIIAGISFVLLISIINTLLYSLARIKEQANAISEHKFIIEKRSPFIKEFDLLVKAMNQMVTTVEGIFHSEVKTFEKYQNILYRDDETSLPNKKYFILKLKEALDDDGTNVGHIALISVEGLEKLKNEKSYDVYKEALMKFISNIPKELSANNLIARISHDEFAILFHTHEISKIEQYFQDLQISLDLTNKNLKSFEKLLCFSIGIAPYYENDKLSEALSRVDYSLSRSKINGCNLVDIYQENEQNHALITLGKNSWKQMFEKIFNDKRIVLAMQSTLNKERDEKFHDEVLVRIKEDDGSLQTAGYYLPMANALGLIAKFDHNVIGSVVEKIATYSYPVAINISKDFIVQSLYFLELRNTLSALRKSNPQMLHFECSEHDILLELESYIEFSDMLHAHNQSFGIDRFSGIENIGYIKKLRPDYIKINVNFILESHDNNAAILNTLNILSQTMGITLIITAVQSKEQFEKLQEIGYKNFQGHFIADIVLT